MSSFKITAVLALTLAISGCGFAPLYGERAAGRAAAEDQLALIRIVEIKDRVGQQLHNGLLDRLTPKGQPGDPAYVLKATISESTVNLGVQKTAVATRAVTTLRVAYALSLATGDTTTALTSGTVRAVSGYDISSSSYATLIASRDARTRSVREVADDIRTRLAVYFHRQKSDAR